MADLLIDKKAIQDTGSLVTIHVQHAAVKYLKAVYSSYVERQEYRVQDKIKKC